ncbi:MAG TPA: DUF2510 domain-containing protein [Gaiellaceae bacterium]|nr:DUF2510 domain-containing protein [Gaiellaceae bacterium]
MHKAGILAWALVSAGLMAIGAFGPWITALGVLSLTGWDVQKHEAVALLLIALLGALAVFARRTTTDGGVYALIAGAAGVLLTGWEHHHITSAFASSSPEYQTLERALVHIGWGLDLAIVASISIALSGFVSLFFEPGEPRAATTPAAKYGPNVPTVPAGWYRDPNDAALLRYWNGFGWTTQTAKPAS